MNTGVFLLGEENTIFFFFRIFMYVFTLFFLYVEINQWNNCFKIINCWNKSMKYLFQLKLSQFSQVLILVEIERHFFIIYLVFLWIFSLFLFLFFYCKTIFCLLFLFTTCALMTAWRKVFFLLWFWNSSWNTL